MLSRIFFKKNRVLNAVHSIIEPVKPHLKSVPLQGQTISVETALNSRCTSDYDDDQRRSHWGMFEATRKLTAEQVEKIVSLAKIPQFTEQHIEIRAKKSVLTFVIQKSESETINEWAMIESGMQQQAVGLVCAALGVGMVFSNLGRAGRAISSSEHATIRIKLAPIKPSYNGEYWSNQAPAGENSWKTGNLPNPLRDGDKPLLSTLANLKTENEGSCVTTDHSISQLLWAARGRTPHFYKSKPWGMTIPTWAGEQNISGVYLLSRERILKYVNWENNKPTHSLSQIISINNDLNKELLDPFSLRNNLIVLGKNEDSGRALWEIGYQFLNLILQASSLRIAYKALLLGEGNKTEFARAGISAPVAVLAI